MYETEHELTLHATQTALLSALATPAARRARSHSVPAPLTLSREATAAAMSGLWDMSVWNEHRSPGRWAKLVRRWPESSVLRAIRVPLLAILAFASFVVAFNRLHSGCDFMMSALGGGMVGACELLAALPQLVLPLAPLSLQAASIGLLLTFRANQTHDRLKEGAKALAGLGSITRCVA